MTSTLILLRHLRPADLARDFIMLVLVGTLGAFGSLFSARITLDRLVFESSLEYGWSGAAPTRVADGLNLTEVPSVTISRLSAAPSGGSKIGDLEHSSKTPLFVFDGSEMRQLENVFLGVIVAGHFSASGVAVDEATATLFDVTVGDSVIISVNTESALVERSFPIAAIILPYESIQKGTPEGLMIVPGDLLQSFPAGSFEGSPVTYSDHALPGAQSRVERMADMVFGGPGVTAFVLAVLALGVGVWILGNLRFCSELLFRLRPSVRILQAIGSPSWKTRGTVGLVVFLLSASAGCAAVVASGWLITSWTHYYIQVRVAGIIAGVLMIPSFVVLAGFLQAFTLRNLGGRK